MIENYHIFRIVSKLHSNKVIKIAMFINPLDCLEMKQSRQSMNELLASSWSRCFGKKRSVCLCKPQGWNVNEPSWIHSNMYWRKAIPSTILIVKTHSCSQILNHEDNNYHVFSLSGCSRHSHILNITGTMMRICWRNWHSYTTYW